MLAGHRLSLHVSCYDGELPGKTGTHIPALSFTFQYSTNKQTTKHYTTLHNTTDIEMIHFKTLFLLFVEFIVEKHCRIHEYNNDNNEYSSSDGSAAEK